jgi:hypothetical protein
MQGLINSLEQSQNLRVAQLVKKLHSFKKSKALLPSSQEPATGLYREQDESR